MAKPDDIVKDSWGTWEELLLACAVNRHGTKNWDSVAMEIQNRSSSVHLLTAQNCKQKYHDLKRRFMSRDDEKDDGEDGSGTGDKKREIPWLDELKELRVAELRREVQRYDVSIVTLQLKVKRLKEERDRSLRENENSEQKPDLVKDLDKEKGNDEKKEREGGQDKSLPEYGAGISVSGEDSDHENQSFNESNSTDPKRNNRENWVDEPEQKREPDETVAGRPDPVSGESKPVGETSFNGSSDTIAKESAAPPVRKSSGAITARESGDSPELWESVAESKGGGEEGAKENSDVQSSASLSRKDRREKTIAGSSSGEEPETDEVSPAIKRMSVKSQPLVGFLEIIRSHKYGSTFERRLESQETEAYRCLIRQHVDLGTVWTRLEEGWYSGSSRKFFRDLLLLFNNALVFFPNNSPESVAAIGLRELVSKEMEGRIRNSGRRTEEPDPPPPLKPEPADSQLVKPKSSGPMIVCRKRSSISTKPSSAVVERKGEQRTTSGIDEKPVLDQKQPNISSANVVEEQRITKKRTRERSTSGARSYRTGSKSRTNNNSNQNPNATSGQNHSPIPNHGSSDKEAAVPDDSLELKSEKKNNTTAVAKKRSAANFLKRMKRNSSSSGTLIETLKNSVNNSSNGKVGGGGSEKKKGSGGGGGRSDGQKDQVSRQSSSGKQAVEKGSPVKRSVGRPPKRATAAPPPLPPPAPPKRARETVDTEVVASRQPKKRGRR